MNTDAAIEPQLGGAVDLIVERVRQTLAEHQNGFPHFADPKTGEWTRSAAGDWTGGFWVGQLWLLGKIFGEEFLAPARHFSTLLAPRITSKTIFRGFLFWYGSSLGQVLLADPGATERAQAAARSLNADFDPTIGVIPLGAEGEEAQDVGDYETNIDGVPGGAPLLLSAGQLTGDGILTDHALRHVRTHVSACLRGDGSVVQSATMDPRTGAVVRTYTHKGFSDHSTWSRAQSWAMLGLAQASHYTPEFRPDLQRVCDWWLDHLPADHVSRWDFDAPEDTAPRWDTSATAIAAAALLKAATHLPHRAQRYRSGAVDMLGALTRHQIQPDDPRGGAPGALIDACYHHRLGLATEHELIWGDYFFLEALLVATHQLDSAQL